MYYRCSHSVVLSNRNAEQPTRSPTYAEAMTGWSAGAALDRRGGSRAQLVGAGVHILGPPGLAEQRRRLPTAAPAAALIQAILPVSGHVSGGHRPHSRP